MDSIFRCTHLFSLLASGDTTKIKYTAFNTKYPTRIAVGALTRINKINSNILYAPYSIAMVASWLTIAKQSSLLIVITEQLSR